MGKKDVALQLFNQATSLSHDPDLRGTVLTLVNEAISLDHENIEFYQLKMTTLSYMERLDEALQCFEEGVKLAPTNVKLYYAKIVILVGLGRRQEADDCFDFTLTLELEEDASSYS